MPRYGLAIQKRVAYRGGIQHFNNTYYYQTDIGTANLNDLNLLVDEVVAKEKAMFATAVTFVQARLWSQIGTPAENEMLIDKALTGTGALIPGAYHDRERAFLVRWRAGVDTKGRPVYLRKWWHLLANTIGAAGITQAMLEQTAELAAGTRSALETFADSVANFTTAGSQVRLVAKSGRQITGGTQAHRYLEHRQLGDEWRGA